MDGYDHTGTPYMGTPLSFTNPVTNDQYLNTLSMQGLPDQAYRAYHQQQLSNYSTEDFGGNNVPSLPFAVPAEAERAFSNPYDEFQYDHISHGAQEALDQPAGDISIDRDDALLSFNPPTHNFTLLDYSLHQTSVSLNARLHGMFFMADNPSTPGLYPQMTPPELTCYRRNLFQVTGSITLPRSLRYILMDDGVRIPIVGQELQVTATESVEGHNVKVVSVPWKTSLSSGPPAPQDKTEKEPATIPLDMMSNQEMDANYATFPIAWKRLQFRTATANNGRRKELQQHFVAKLKLVATLPNGSKVPIAEAKSAAIVVRGRSPRNFQQRKDTAGGGEKNTIRKGPSSPGISNRKAPADASKSPLKRERSGENPSASFTFHVNDSQAQGPNAFSNNWSRHTNGSSSAPALPTPNFITPTLPSSKSNSSASPPSLPQPLSLTSDLAASQRPNKLPRTNSRPHPYKYPSLPSPRSLLSNSQNMQPHCPKRGEGADPADMLYEYFPLANDDMQRPVDAVYRPHVVHHIPMTAGAGGRPGIGGRNQRYFSENVS